MSEPINGLDPAAAAAEQWRRERPDIDPFPMEVLGRLGEITLIIMRDRLIPFLQSMAYKAGSSTYWQHCGARVHPTNSPPPSSMNPQCSLQVE